MALFCRWSFVFLVTGVIIGSAFIGCTKGHSTNSETDSEGSKTNQKNISKESSNGPPQELTDEDWDFLDSVAGDPKWREFPDSIPLLQLSDEELNATKKRLLSLMQSEFSTVQEQAIIGIGRLGTEANDVVPILTKALTSKDDHVKRAANRALGRIGEAAYLAIPTMIKTLEEESVRPATIAGLSDLGQPILSKLSTGIAHPEFKVRYAITRVFVKYSFSFQEYRSEIAALLADQSESVKVGACDLLQNLKENWNELPDELRSSYIECLKSDNHQLARSALRNLCFKLHQDKSHKKEITQPIKNKEAIEQVAQSWSQSNEHEMQMYSIAILYYLDRSSISPLERSLPQLISSLPTWAQLILKNELSVSIE